METPDATKPPRRRNQVPIVPLAIDGFRDDMGVLLTNFLIKKSFRLVDFVVEWEKMNFGHVFGGTQTHFGGLSEIYQFAEKCFREALNQCVQPMDILGRVAGLYLLYSLYITRPNSCHARIRIHPAKEMAPLLDTVLSLLDGQHYDTVYVFLELYEQNAFRYAFTPHEMGYQTQQSKPFRDDRSVHAYTQNLNAFLTSSTITEVREWDRIYTDIKSRIHIEGDTEPDPDSNDEPLSLELTSSLDAQIDDLIATYETCMASLDNGQPEVIPVETEAPVEGIAELVEEVQHGDMESIGERRQRLRIQSSKVP